MASHRPSIPRHNNSPETEQPGRYFATMILCSASPLLIAFLLPEPLHGAFLLLGEFMLAFVFFFSLALLLHGISLVWHIMRPARHEARLLCPACHTYEQGYVRFNVVRIAPSIYRIHCAECGERWVERR